MGVEIIKDLPAAEVLVSSFGASARRHQQSPIRRDKLLSNLFAVNSLRLSVRLGHRQATTT